MEHGIKEMLRAYEKALENGSLLTPETAEALTKRMETDMSVRDAVLLMAGAAGASNGRNASLRTRPRSRMRSPTCYTRHSKPALARSA